MHTTDEDEYVLVPSENDKTEEDTVVQMSEKPSKSRVDHDEIEKLLGDVPPRQNFSQQLYCPSDFDTEATGRYNRRFSEYDFHSHRATPSLSHRTHYRKSLREPYRDGGLQWRRSVTVHGVPKNSRRFSSGRDVPENSLSGNTPGLTKSQTAEEPLTLIEESDVTNHQKEYQPGQEEEVDNEVGIVLKTRNWGKDGEVEESDVEEDMEGEEGKKRDGKLLELRIKEDDEKSQQGEHETQDEAEERLKRLSPVYTPNASYRKSKRHKPSRLHSPPLHAETRQDEGFSDNGPASPQQLSEVTDLEEACSLDQHALQRIASEYVRVQVLKPTINFLLVDDDKEENEDEKGKEEQHPWQRKNDGDCQKGRDRPRLSFHLDDEYVPSAHDKKGSVSLLQVPGSQKNAIPKESHQREWLSHHIQGKDGTLILLGSIKHCLLVDAAS